MSCKDKEKFATAEASTKAAMRTKGAIDKFLNITDTALFRKLNKQWSNVAKERYGLIGKLFLEENDKAIPNSTLFQKIDEAKKPKPYVLASKKNLQNLVGNTSEKFGVTEEDPLEDEEDFTDISNSIKSVLFNGELRDMKAQEVLANILDSNIYNKNSYMSKLIERLLDTEASVQITDNLDGDTYMSYDSRTKKIKVSEEVLGQVSSVEEGVSKFIHEVFHDKTLRILMNPKTADELKLVGDLKRDYTKVKNFLEETYPHELSSLAEFTAGMFSNKEFEADVKDFIGAGFWYQIKDFFRKIFGLGSEYDALMDRLLQAIDTTGEVYEDDVLLDSKYTVGKERIERRSALDNVSDNIENVLKVLEIQSNRTKADTSFKKTLRKTNKEFTEAADKFNDDIDSYRKEAIKIFLKFMSGQLAAVEKRLTDDKKFSSRSFNFSKAYIDSFINIQDDLTKALDELKKANKITDEEYLEVESTIKVLDAISLRAKKDLIRAGKKYITNNSSQFSRGYREAEMRYKHKFEAEARKQGYKGGKIEEYVNTHMASFRTIIKKETNEEFVNMLDHPIVDIDSLSTMLNSEKDFNHPIINIFSSILDRVKDVYENVIQVRLIKLQEDTNKFLEGKRSKSSDENYKNLVEFSKDGRGFLKGEYKIEYYDIVKDLKDKRNQAQFEHGSESDEYKKATKEYKDFIDENTMELGDSYIVPIDKWRNDLSTLTANERVYLKSIQKIAKESHTAYGMAAKSLKKIIGHGEFFELPKIRKAQITSIKSGDIVQTAKEFFNETFTRQSDQEDQGELTTSKEENIYKVYTDLSGKEVRYVPIHYRIAIEQKEQSIDLPTIYALEYQNAIKFREKNRVANDLLMFKDVIQEGKFTKRKGFGSRFISSVYNKNNDPIQYNKEDVHLIKMLDTILNNRLYDKTNEYAGKLGKYDVNKLESLLRSTVSKASMALNTIGAPANLLTGKSQTLLEVLRDPNLHRENVMKGEKFYWNNLGGFIDDLGRNVYKSIGNQILLSYGGLVSSQMLQNNFEKNKTLAFANDKFMYFGQEAGEHNIQAIHTFTILDAAKILNKNGEYLNKEGKVVSDKSQAASLLDITVLKDGVLETTLKDFYTTLDRLNDYQRGGRATIRSYIQSSLIRAQGNYGHEYTAEIQRHFWGKALAHFKKHIISPMLSRWRGVSTNLGEDFNIKYNYDLQRPDEGNYVTWIRFLKNVVLPKIKSFQLKLIIEDFNNMPQWEQANIKRTFSELLLVMSFASLAYLFAASAGDDDEELWFAAAMFRRLQSEASQYYDITEAWRVLKNPISSLAILEDASRMIGAVTNFADPFEDDRIGQLQKAAFKVAKYTPGYKIIKNPEDAYNYLNRN